MKISKLHYITNGASEVEILEEVKAVLDAGCTWIQLRIKKKELDFLEIAKKVKSLCHNRAVFLINDKVEIAHKVNADGVHLGLEDMKIPKARKVLGPTRIIGGTANTKANCIMHQNNGADYIGLGPYQTTNTKKKLSPILGLDGYQKILPTELCEITLPVMAIGGIQLADIELLKKETGIHGVAVSSLIATAEDKSKMIKAINELILTA